PHFNLVIPSCNCATTVPSPLAAPRRTIGGDHWRSFVPQGEHPNVTPVISCSTNDPNWAHAVALIASSRPRGDSGIRRYGTATSALHSTADIYLTHISGSATNIGRSQPYSITSSARASSVGGMVRSIALAVLPKRGNRWDVLLLPHRAHPVTSPTPTQSGPPSARLHPQKRPRRTR